MLIRRLKRWWAHQDHNWGDPLVEGWYADQYTTLELRLRISQAYQQRYCQGPTPFTHPERYDPLTPPEGYRYDPYYEIWIKND